MSCCDFSYLSASYKPLCFSARWILNPATSLWCLPLLLLPMLLHWKCYWEHTGRDRHSASVVLIIGFNGKIRKILLILFDILSQTCSSGSCLNWLLPILYKKVLSQCWFQSFGGICPPPSSRSSSVWLLLSRVGGGGEAHKNEFCILKPLLSFLFHVVQVAFAPGGRVLAARARPRLRWWTAGGVVAPKWSPSPSVRTAHIPPHLWTHPSHTSVWSQRPY